MNRPTLADLSPRARAEAVAQLKTMKHPVTIAAGHIPAGRPVASKRRIRQKQGEILNELEKRFLAKLVADYGPQPMFAQAIRLELARGTWYKPDFFLPAVLPSVECGIDHCRRAIAYEVKGPKAFRGGFENLKRAARAHQWCRFFLVWEDVSTGQWQCQEVLP